MTRQINEPKGGNRKWFFFDKMIINIPLYTNWIYNEQHLMLDHCESISFWYFKLIAKTNDSESWKRERHRERMDNRNIGRNVCKYVCQSSWSTIFCFVSTQLTTSEYNRHSSKQKNMIHKQTIGKSQIIDVNKQKESEQFEWKCIYMEQEVNETECIISWPYS